MTAVARDIRHLNQRVYEYLRRSKGVPMRRLRDHLANHFSHFEGVAIVGGLVRDLARDTSIKFKSDVDLVIDAEPELVLELARKLDATPNRFGGYAAHLPNWKIDFWALKKTWAATAGYVRVENLKDIIHTTFFDCDAVCYELGSRKVYASHGYLDRLRARTIDVNLLPNPSVEGNLLRAARRILLWGFQPGAVLQSFIAENLSDQTFRRIREVEAELYPNPVTLAFGSATALEHAIFSETDRGRYNVNLTEQFVLPGFAE
jgi:hypothetical protein